MNEREQTTVDEPAGKIIEAVARLQDAFGSAGLLEPVAIVLAGEEQKMRLESLFNRYLVRQSSRPWEITTIRGIKVICNVQA